MPFRAFFQKFAFGWKVAHKTKKPKFHQEFFVFWCSTWPPSHKTSGDISDFTLCFEIWQQQHPIYFFCGFQNNPWSIFTLSDGNISGFVTDYYAKKCKFYIASAIYILNLQGFDSLKTLCDIWLPILFEGFVHP